MRSRVSVVSKCPKCFKMSNFACRVGACHTCATLAWLVLLIGIDSFLFLYRALASIFSVFVEASVVVNKGRVVVNPEYKDYPACSYLSCSYEYPCSYPLSADVYRCL